MRHPFDGLNLSSSEEVSRRTALAAMAGSLAGVAGLAAAAQAQKIIITTRAVGEAGAPVATTLALGEEAGKVTTKALGEEGASKPVTTEPFGEEAGKVVSQAVPGLEDGGKPGGKPVTRVRAEAGGGPTTLALGEEGGKVTTKALREEGALTRARREEGIGIVPVKPESHKLSDRQLEANWAALANQDSRRAVQACAILYGAKNVVPFLARNLQADKFKVKVADPEEVAKLIAKLDADDYTTRQRAEDALVRLGPTVASQAEQALQKAKSAEQRLRLTRVLARTRDEGNLRQARRGLEVLVALPNPEARKLLKSLAEGKENTWLNDAAREALERTNKKK
jgi:hypothetical protein